MNTYLHCICYLLILLSHCRLARLFVKAGWLIWVSKNSLYRRMPHLVSPITLVSNSRTSSEGVWMGSKYVKVRYTNLSFIKYSYIRWSSVCHSKGWEFNWRPRYVSLIFAMPTQMGGLNIRNGTKQVFYRRMSSEYCHRGKKYISWILTIVMVMVPSCPRKGTRCNKRAWYSHS